ncbi:cyclin-dependent kinase 5 activator 1-like [Eleutherodactylus coqui]|uniref:cyclin-dependent kinase 5 activator 1-like n=1 Tax=Eleutherodactylus coqui TaxID=57060 RepID=UPI003461F34F
MLRQRDSPICETERISSSDKMGNLFRKDFSGEPVEIEDSKVLPIRVDVTSSSAKEVPHQAAADKHAERRKRINHLLKCFGVFIKMRCPKLDVRSAPGPVMWLKFIVPTLTMDGEQEKSLFTQEP